MTKNGDALYAYFSTNFKLNFLFIAGQHKKRLFIPIQQRLDVGVFKAGQIEDDKFTRARIIHGKSGPKAPNQNHELLLHNFVQLFDLFKFVIFVKKITSF